jgi:hypothetical protein
MKSLYNIAGILPAQCRANPNDCGIAWSEHRKVEKVRRDEEINVEVPPHNDALTEYLKETMAACMSKLMIMPKLMIDVNPADQGADQTVTTAFTLKPIDPQTIKVGDTVRLVGSRTITEWPNCCLDVGEDYKVKAVDRESEDGLTVGFFLTEFSKPFWIYDEDLMLVESA